MIIHPISQCLASLPYVLNTTPFTRNQINQLNVITSFLDITLYVLLVVLLLKTSPSTIIYYVYIFYIYCCCTYLSVVHLLANLCHYLSYRSRL